MVYNASVSCTSLVCSPLGSYRKPFFLRRKDVMQRDMTSKQFQNNGQFTEGIFYEEDIPFEFGQVTVLESTSSSSPASSLSSESLSSAPAASYRIIFGLISAIIWLLLITLGIASYLVEPVRSPTMRLFLLLTVMMFTLCLISSNILFGRIGLLLMRKSIMERG